MNKKTTIWTDSETLGKLRRMAPGGNVSAFLREIANGKVYQNIPSDNPGGLTIRDLATQIGAFEATVLRELRELRLQKGDVNKTLI